MNEYKIIPALLKRLFTSILLLFLLITFLFFLLRAAPGDPTKKYIAAELTPQLNERVREQFNLDKPVGVQYLSFIKNLSQGEMGVSYNYRQPVSRIISEFLPFTIIFAVCSLFIQLIAGYFLALFIFKKKNPKYGRSASIFSLILYSAPTFITGVLLILIFSEYLQLLPSSGLKSFNNNGLPFWERLWDYGKHLILPVVTLSAGGAAMFYNYIKENLDEVSSRLFVLNLRANGFSMKEIIRKHIIPNAVGPVLSVASVEFGILLGGALITEVIFGLPGMGRLTVNAILTRDYPLVIGCTFFAGFMIIISNLIADIIKARVDKRLLAEGILN